MTYEEYSINPFSMGVVTETDFSRYQSYAETGIRIYISRVVPRWRRDFTDMTDVLQAIQDATVLQMDYLKNRGMRAIVAGGKRKAESLEGYSLTFDDAVTIVNGDGVLNTAIQRMEVAFRDAGLLYRGVE